MCQVQEADAEGQVSGRQSISPRLRETTQYSDELLTTQSMENQENHVHADQ